jgi:hypothetical protein
LEDVLIELRKTSIRGRMAFGITCLELACQAFALDTLELQQLINHLWSFTSTLDFCQWEEDLIDGVGGYFLDLYDNRHKPSQSSEVYSLNIFEIGRGNLYGGTGEYSEFTLRHTAKVIGILQFLHLTLPKFSNFSRSRFSEEYGWGTPVPASYFR